MTAKKSTEKIHGPIQHLAVPIDSLVFYPKNARIHDMPRIERSMAKHGQYRPITAHSVTREIIAGNGTVQAALNLGWKNIAATFVEDIDEVETAILVAIDNKLNDNATYDPVKLAELIGSVPDVTETGFTEEELERLVHKIAPEPEQAGSEADELPFGSKSGICKAGDVWELGEHRLVVGDATDPDTLRQLLGFNKADCMWTDPPYGVNYTGKTEDALQIQGDHQMGLEALLRGAFGTARPFLRPGAPVYVCHADTERIAFETALAETGYKVRQNLIWVKNTMVLGHSDYHYKHEPVLAAEIPEQSGKGHEPVLYGFTEGGTGRLGRGGAQWWGENNATTVFEYPKPPASREHPTMKPVALIQAMLKNSVKPNGIVLDPFCGSGSTLIAANYQRIRAYVAELDPKYADIICARYQKLTGNLPTRDRKEYDFGGGFSGDDGK